MRTVIRVLEKLENLNVIERTSDDRDARVTRIELSDCFAAEKLRPGMARFSSVDLRQNRWRYEAAASGLR